MTDKDSNFTQNGQDGASIEKPEQEKGVTFSRRRLIKIGVTAVPVVLTLASRPVMAWHCQSPSAWGSEQINPNTSLKTNPGHDKYVDETWTITNWMKNTGRAAVLSGTPPWRKLAKAIPSIASISNYKFVTVGQIRAALPALPPGVDNLHKVYEGLSGKKPNGQPSTFTWDEFAKYMVVAQLNRYLLAAGVWDPQCVTETELTAMVGGTYPTPGIAWDITKIKKYLYNNWIVRP